LFSGGNQIKYLRGHLACKPHTLLYTMILSVHNINNLKYNYYYANIIAYKYNNIIIMPLVTNYHRIHR